MERGNTKVEEEQANALLDEVDEDESTEVTPREQLPDYRNYRAPAHGFGQGSSWQGSSPQGSSPQGRSSQG